MLGKRSRPTTVAKLAGALRSTGIMDSSTSPRSPLDCKILSPRGSKNYDQLGGVGLAIAVSLDNNNNNSNGGCGSGGEIIAKYAVCGQFSSRSNPIPVNYSSKASNQLRKGGEDQEMMLEEEFTYVTCHGPNKSMTTKVYYDGCENVHVQATMSSRRINQNLGVFKISSPATTTLLFDDRCCSSDNDFLSSCYLCRKTLHGKDIYMYRGEKAFCSTECRQRQMGIDERKEQQCRSEASRSSNVSNSYISRGQIFSTGIVAV